MQLPLPRQIWWAFTRGVEANKDRLCIVVSAHDKHLQVVYGQSNDDGSESFNLDPSMCRVDGLTHTTYFRATNVALVPKSALKNFAGMCPIGSFLKAIGYAEKVWVNGNFNGDDQRPLSSVPPH